MTDPSDPTDVPDPEPAVEPETPAPSSVDGPPATARQGSLRTIVVAALLSAVLASGGTVALLDATGALSPRVVPGSSTGGTSSVHQPVTIDESSAVIDVATKVNPAVVPITATGDTTHSLRRTIPRTRGRVP